MCFASHLLVQQRWDPSKPAPTMADFDKKLTESDAYLQLLIDQTTVLEKHMLTTEDEADRQRCQAVIGNINNVLESIKHSIVLLQVSVWFCQSVRFYLSLTLSKCLV